MKTRAKPTTPHHTSPRPTCVRESNRPGSRRKVVHSLCEWSEWSPQLNWTPNGKAASSKRLAERVAYSGRDLRLRSVRNLRIHHVRQQRQRFLPAEVAEFDRDHRRQSRLDDFHFGPTRDLLQRDRHLH